MNKNRQKSIKKASSRRLIFGFFLIGLSIFLFLSFVSYLIYWKDDQSQITKFFDVFDTRLTAKNWLGKLGAWISHLMIYKSFGIASIFFPILFFVFGYYLLFRKKIISFFKSVVLLLFFLLWCPIFFGFISASILAGAIGYQLNDILGIMIGRIGIVLVLVLSMLAFFFSLFNIHPDLWGSKAKKAKNKNPIKSDEGIAYSPTEKSPSKLEDPELKLTLDLGEQESNKTFNKEKIDISVEKQSEERTLKENISNRLVKEYGEYDPRLELSNYKFPSLDLLRSYDNSQIKVDQSELEANKNKIVETLSHYGIKISKIKATIGPTVTLYEIVPAAGVRISKIKNLENDIALNLAALGIRIIAPIPGKGTIGIEVPNNTPSIVSMKSVLASEKFQKSIMELPIALGKTISNETLIFDLTKMPHLLMAGATGQGKSVGLNAIITSLLYKKHPAEVKFIFIDPKKVELTLYNKIERHFLAKMPEYHDPIITEDLKVIETLNSLCIEMDNRYDLLKKASVRNLKEYNNKFKNRKLNPENGHRYLPYIVVVIDEFADLIMTAGKEVEMPLGRIAQLARAIGIHLVIATQRPSVNIITGLIKANFPARIAFRVTSKIDSRTILDNGGAEQLIGRGDLLLSTGSDLVRLQCAFIDTPEVEEITEFIGSQKAFTDAFLLPEYTLDTPSSSTDTELGKWDELFDQAAQIIVENQQGSASLLQRKLKLGYNRAGRLVDQLEMAGIIGPFEGSKARQVLVPDLATLKELLSQLNKKL